MQKEKETCAIFHAIPEMLVGDSSTVRVTDCGAGNYVMEIEGTSLEEYSSYLKRLLQNGFVKYADNGSEGLEHCVWSSTYTKEKLVVTVIHVSKRNRTYITVGKDIPLSKHLFYQDEYVSTNSEDVKTSLHMLELHTYGDSFIIQLKDGHFILDDSGMPMDALYLLEYLESLTPKDEKPVIDAWFITHGHGDHLGAFIAFANNPEYAKRIVVEGVYFSEPSIEVCTTGNALEQVQVGVKGVKECRTCSGAMTPIYRPQVGQRYYFNDITIDVLHTQEQLPLENYRNGFNDSSTWYLYTIEGQKFLHGGDAGRGSVEVVKSTYEQEYLDFDIMTTFHHGQNISESFVDYFNYKTVLYTTFVIGSQTADWKTEENKRMQERAMECLSWGNGAKILTFPYQIGTAVGITPKEWTYHPDREVPTPYKLDV